MPNTTPYMNETIVPYTILSLMIATLAALRFDSITWARLACMAASALIAVGYMRKGLLGGRLHDIVAYTPAWKILSTGIVIIMIETLIDQVAPDSAFSDILRSVMGPISFGIIIASAEIALHRRKRPEDEY